MSGHWTAYPGPDQAAEACSRHILALLESALSGEGDATLAISGGSTPKLLFAHLAKSEFDWRQVHFFWVDERAVPPTDPQSNYRLAEEHLVIPGHVPHRNLHRIAGELPPEKAAKRYSDEIREYFGLDPGELPHFDITHLGTGPDSHTASLFPGEPLIEDRQGLAAAVLNHAIPQWRVSLLPGVLLASRHTAFLVAGEDKAEAVYNIFHQPYDPLHYPAQVVTHHGRRVTWFLDEAAARRLD
ncbi:MAG TPA: 6-phosphogluconolactonase [Bryobacteraceae bacterium]|nr:6-phosphogluconolactonase [Bryobacteraceae bacterium]